VEARFSLWRNVVGWRHSKTTGAKLRKKVIVWQFAQANNRMLAGDNTVSDTTNAENDSDLKKKAEAMKLPQLRRLTTL
jgi:hypothetical protein